MDDDARRQGRDLKRAREDAHLDQEAAAQLLGVSVVTLSRRENGRTPIAPTEVARMLAVYERRGRTGDDADVSRATSRRAPAGVDPRSYWRGRMERTSEMVAALRAMVALIDDDLRDLLEGDALQPLPAGADGGSVPRPSDEEMAALQAVRRRRIAQKMRELEEHGPPGEPPNAPPAPRGRAGGE